MKINKLSINDYVEIDKRIFKIILKPCSNGTKKFYIPILKLVKPELEYKKGLTQDEKNILKMIIDNTPLKKPDYPIKESEIKPKDIFKK